MSCDIRSGQMVLQQAFLRVSSFSPASNRSTTAPYPPSPPLAVWHTPDSEALCHILGLWAGGFISATALGWLQRAALLNRRDKGVKEWEFMGLEDRKCVSNYCYVGCNQFQPCKFDSNLQALYEQNRESRHLQSLNRIHYSCLFCNSRHCTDVKWFCLSAVCQTDIGTLIDQSEDSILFTFSPSYPFCALLLQWSSHPYIVDKSSTHDTSDDSSLISDTWCGPWCDVYTHRRENSTVLNLPDRSRCNLAKEICTTFCQLLIIRLTLVASLLRYRSCGGWGFRFPWYCRSKCA